MALTPGKAGSPGNDNMRNDQITTELLGLVSPSLQHVHAEGRGTITHIYVPRKWLIVLIIFLILSMILSIASFANSLSRTTCTCTPLPSSSTSSLLRNASSIAPSPVTSQPSGSPITARTASPVISQPSGSPIAARAPSPVTSPTYAYSASVHVGDYKVSVQNQSHGNWLLCDGSFLDPRDYGQLFDVIGFSFGKSTSATEYVSSGSTYELLSRFALPNASDRVVGINGNTYKIGDKVGNESGISLSEDNIPPHSHSLSLSQSGGLIGGSTSRHHYIQLGSAFNCRYTNYSDPLYKLSKTGSGTSFKVYQPTIFVGHLFIFSGV
eukprot:22872_1